MEWREVSFEEYTKWVIDCSYDEYTELAEGRGFINPYDPYLYEADDEVVRALRTTVPVCFTLERFEATARTILLRSDYARNRLHNVFSRVRGDQFQEQSSEKPLQSYLALCVLVRRNS